MKKYILLAVAAISITACNTADNNIDDSIPAQVTATIGESARSRAADGEWTPGDCIGISSTVGSVAGPYINVKYTTAEGDENFDGAPLYFYKPMTLTAYYPFTGEEGTVPGNDGLITADTRPVNQTPENRPLIDFLWDSQNEFTAANPDVNFTFSHKMSKLTFTFINGEKVDVSDISAYEIIGLRHDGTFNTATGECTVNDDASPVDIMIDDLKGKVVHGEELSPLIVFPQAPGTSTVMLRLYLDELDSEADMQKYTCTLAFGDGELKPGHSYKYTIQITKAGLKVGKMSILDWDKEEEVKINATIE